VKSHVEKVLFRSSSSQLRYRTVARSGSKRGAWTNKIIVVFARYWRFVRVGLSTSDHGLVRSAPGPCRDRRAEQRRTLEYSKWKALEEALERLAKATSSRFSLFQSRQLSTRLEELQL
jgi:hypothetical protein